MTLAIRHAIPLALVISVGPDDGVGANAGTGIRNRIAFAPHGRGSRQEPRL